jgi:hypothetical protein
LEQAHPDPGLRLFFLPAPENAFFSTAGWRAIMLKPPRVDPSLRSMGVREPVNEGTFGIAAFALEGLRTTLPVSGPADPFWMAAALLRVPQGGVSWLD